MNLSTFDPRQTRMRVLGGRPTRFHRCRVCCRMRTLLGQPLIDDGFQPADQPLVHLPGCPLYRKPPLLPVDARAVVMCPVGDDRDLAGATGVVAGYTERGFVRLQLDRHSLRHHGRRLDWTSGRPIALLRPESLAIACD